MKIAVLTTRLAVGLAGAVSVNLCGASSRAAPIARSMVVTDAWSRPTPKGLPTGVVYLSIANHGRAPDRLVSATTPVAAQMQLHRSSMHAGIMTMEAVPQGLAIPPGGVVRATPGGYHFMLVGLKGGLTAGQRFSATLTFVHAGAVRTEVQVRTGAPQMTMR